MPFSRAFFPVFSRDIFNSKVVSFVTFLALSALFFSPLSPFAIEQPAEAASAYSGTCEQSLGSASNVDVLDIYTNGKVTECRVKFTAGSNSWTVPQGVTSVKVLVVGGGGGGGTHVGGGGGGGAVYENLAYGVTPLSNISVTVGAGGTGAVSSAPYCVSAWAYTGGTSTFGGTNVLGGGHGASWEWQYAGTGANGGGGSSSKFGEAWFDGAQGQASTGWSGYKGGNAPDRTMSHSYGYPTGGGAGATSNGSDAQGLASGSGGAGKYSEITGTYFGGGGGGGFHGGLTDGRVTIAGSGGIGGGGAGNGSTNGTSPGKATSGAANTGGGGGGSGAPCGNLSNNVVYSEGGNGGSGVVIVQYSVPNPVNTARPTVAGSANVGSYLQASQGTWSNPITKLTYQWQASTDQNLWVDIVGATSNSYKLTSNEANKYMRVVVFATNQYGTTDATSVGTGQVNGTSSDACAQTVTNSSTIQVTEIATSGGGIDCVVKFTSGTNTWTKPTGATSARLLIVGGGGAGGGGIGGGGGAGEMVEVSSLALDQSTYSVTVGGGGLTVANAGPAGSNSAFSTITAYGGGGGGLNENYGPTAPQGFGGYFFGSSGGGAYPNTSWTGSTRVYGVQDNSFRNLPAGVAAYRSNGGFGSGGGGDYAASAGGGGAGSGGGAGMYNQQAGGDGGPGRASDITGVAQLYAAGGGGGVNGHTGALSRGVPGNGGSAIGGSGGGKAPNCVNRDGGAKDSAENGCWGNSGVANTGSGGGGGSNATFGGDGGSGVVILRYSLAAQTALTVSPTTTTYGSTQTLSTSGGSGSGAVTYTVSDTGTALCSISGATLSFTAAGTCKVTAAKATGGGYLPTTSLATTVTVGTASMGTVATPAVTATSGVANSIDVSWSSVTNADRYYVKLFNSAGTTELFQKTVSSGTSTTITASDYASITSAQSYKVSVGAASSTGNYSLGAQSTQVAVTVNIAQAALSISTTTATFGSTRTLSTTGGSGTGAVTYQVTTAGTANCSVSGTTLSYTHAGTCSVTATKAAQGSYLAASSAATTITVNPANMGTVSTPTVVATSGVAHSIDVSWTAVTNADRYQVKLFRADTDVLVGYAFVDNATSYTITSADYNDIANLRNYKVTVAAYSSTGDYAEGTPSTSVAVTTNISATVTYSYNGATGGNSTTSRTLITGTTLTLPTPTKTGYTFAGWYTANSGGTKVGDGGASYTPTDSVTLYAIWVNNLMAYEPFTGTASANLAGGTGTGSSGLTGSWILVKAEKQASVLAISHVYTSVANLALPSNTNFTLPSSNTAAHVANWKLSYTAKELSNYISFDSSGTYYYSFINHMPQVSGSPGFGMLGLLSGLPTTTSDTGPWSIFTGSSYSGSFFSIDYGNANRASWVDGQTRGTTNLYSAQSTKSSAPTTEATANFVVVKIVTSASGNDQISLRAFAPNEILPLDPSTITWDAQYSTAITGSAKYVAVQSEYYGALDEFRIGYTYDAVTGVLPVYTVTYNYNSATGGNSTTNADYISGKTAITLPTPTRTGYTFAGWYSEAALTNQVGLAGDSYTPSESGTVYAKWTMNSNTVTFNPNGATGSSTTQSILTDTATALIANTFVRQGYMFSGWDTVALGGGNSYTDGQSVTISGPLNLYAQWAGEIYTVTYNYNGATGGNTSASNNFTYGGAGITLPTPTKTGYTFSGWYEDSSFTGSALASTYSPSASGTIYAKWTSSSFTVTWDSNGGSTVTGSSSFVTGDTIALPTAPTKAGKYFVGWSTTETANQGDVANKITSWPYSPSAANKTFYAIWYDDNSLNLGGSAAASARVGANSTSVNVVPRDSSYTWEAWIYPTGFVGTGTTKWGSVLDNGDSGDNYGRSWLQIMNTGSGPYLSGAYWIASSQGAAAETTANSIVLNKWQHVAMTVTRSTSACNTNGTVYIALYIDGVKKVEASDTAFMGCSASTGLIVGDNYDDANQYFKGKIDQVKIWDGNLTEAEIAASRSTYSNAGVDNTLRAHYDFNDLGATPALNDVVDNVASSATTYNLSIYGASAADVTSNVSRSQNQFQITYDANTATSGTTTTQSSLTPFTPLSTPGAGDLVRTGYSFGGWNTTTTGSGINFLASSTYTLLYGDQTLYSNWTANSNTVTFDANGGTGTMANQTITSGTATALTANSFTRTGYTFAGWATTSNGSVAYANSASVTITAGMDLFAKWTANTNTVAFNNNGGNGTMTSQSITTGTATALSANTFTRTGYTFAGWSTTVGGSVAYANSESVTITAGMTLYASWSANSNTVTYSANGGTGTMASQSIMTGTATALTSNTFTRQGYMFSTWNTIALGGGNSYTNGQSVTLTGPINLYAQWTAGTNTVVFNNNGGTGTMANQTITSDVATTLTTNSFTKTGYTFAGWATSAGGSVAYADSASVTITAGMTLYAQWAAVSNTVTYNANGGSGTMANQSVTTDVATALTTNSFTRTGYTFAGWATTSGGNVVYSNSASVTLTGGLSLYAKWTANTNTVTFNANGGSGTMANQSITSDAATPLTTNSFTKTGYTFAGWATSAGGAVAHANSASVTITSGMDLYAKWTANTNTVTFNANGGTGTIANQSITSDVTTALTANSFTRTGYTFTGWATTSGGNVAYANSASVTITAGMDLFAKWTANTNTVTFDANGGSGTMANQSITSDAATTLSANTFTKTGYTFAGWATSAGGAVAYANSASVTITSGLDLYAKWTANSNTVTFNANGGSGTMANQSITSDVATALTANAFTKTGYTFAGWATSAGGSVVHANSTSVTITSGMSLFAKWTAGTNTIAFDSNGGTGAMTSQSVTSDVSTALSANTFTKTGYTFAGWATSAGGAVAYADGASVTTTIGFTLYAKWTANTYTVTYNYNGADGANSTVTSSYTVDATAVTLPVPTKTGYAFAGWYESSSFTGSALSATYAPTSSRTIYAKWSGNANTVTFNANDGSGTPATSTQSIVSGVTTNLSANTFTRTGYTFARWTTVPNGTGNGYIDQDQVTLTGNLTLYAQWEGNTYTVTYNYDNATGSNADATGSYTVGGTALTLPVPTRTGYTFAGWYETANFSGSALSSTYSPASSRTIYAKWNQIMCAPIISTALGYTVYTFSNVGTCEWSVPNGVTNVQALVVAGGGGGGYSWDSTGAGGGAGGQVKTGTLSLGSSVTVTVGQGGSGGVTGARNGTAGQSSSVSNISALGGNGGCSGRATCANSGTPATANAAAIGGSGGSGGQNGKGGGGSDTTGSVTNSTTGGAGISSSYSGLAVIYGAGGAGGTNRTGAWNIPGTPGPANTGRGGGGASAMGTSGPVNGGAGGSGLVMLRVANTYAVTYDSSNADSGAPSATSTNYTTGATPITLPTQNTLTRAGYTFAGWSTTQNDSSTRVTNSGSYTVSANSTLYALWTAINYSVTYSSLNSDAGTVPTDSTNYNIGNTVAIQANTGNLSRTGYTFGGWVLNSDGSGTVYQSGGSYTIGTSNITLYPKWIANTYTVTYNANGASGSPSRTSDSYTSGTAGLSLPNVGTMLKTGYDFAGWSTSPSGSALSGAYTTSSNVTLYAVWTLKQINYNYHRGNAGGTNVTGSHAATSPNLNAQVGLYGSVINLDNTISRNISVNSASYQFMGWNDGNSIFAPNDAYTLGESGRTFTAEWVRIFEVRYGLNGGTGIIDVDPECTQGSNTCLDGQNITLSAAPTRAGYTFAGWKDQSGQLKNAGASTSVTSSSYLYYAQWDAIDYTISFNSAGGSDDHADQIKNIGDSLLMPNPGTKAGHTFAGWFDGSGNTLGAGAAYTVGASGKTFVALWTPKVYTVSYNWNGGLGAATNNVAYTFGTSAITLPSGSGHSRDGYDFTGWATTPGGTPVGSTFVPIQDTMLYAVWADGHYSVNLNAHGGSVGQGSFTVPRGDDITLPTPTRAGFVFDGWFESVSSSTRVGHGQSAFTPAASRTLHAKWVQNSLYGINPAHINSLTSITVTGGHSWSGTHSASGTGAALNIPNGALASGTQVQVSFIEDMTRPRDLIDNNYAYYTSVVLHWLSGSGDNATVPVTAANKPLTLTLTNPAILPGAKVFMILNGVATEVAEATQEGEVTINVTQDPEFVIAATPPRSPASVTATQVTNSAATVSWTAPASTGGSPITGYTVTASPGGATCVTTTELSCEIRGLSSGVSYSYSVVAENSLGSSTVRSTTIAYVAPPVVAPPINVVPAGNSGTVTGASGSLAIWQSEDVAVESAETLGNESEDINPVSPEADSDTKAEENQATEVESQNNLTGYVTAGGLLLLLVIALAMYFIQRARKKVNP